MGSFYAIAAFVVLLGITNTVNSFSLAPCTTFAPPSIVRLTSPLATKPEFAGRTRGKASALLRMSEEVEREAGTCAMNERQESAGDMYKEQSLGLGDVQRFLDSRDVGYKIVAVQREKDEEVNAGNTAMKLGVNSSLVVKSLVFVVGNSPVLVVLSGSKKVSLKKLSDCLHLHRDRLREKGADILVAGSAVSVRLAPSEWAEEYTGYRIGMIPPFAHSRDMTTIVDKDVLLFPRVFVGCGRLDSELLLEVKDLVAVTDCIVADVGKENKAGESRRSLLPYSQFHLSVYDREVVEEEVERSQGERDEQEVEEDVLSHKLYEISPQWREVDIAKSSSTFLTGDFCLISANKIGRRLMFSFAVHKDMQKEVSALVSSRNLQESIRRRRSWSWGGVGSFETCQTFSLQLIFGKTLTNNIGDEKVLVSLTWSSVLTSPMQAGRLFKALRTGSMVGGEVACPVVTCLLGAGRRSPQTADREN
eukprot:748640-Hanusia_phi.AAC.1